MHQSYLTFYAFLIICRQTNSDAESMLPQDKDVKSMLNLANWKLGSSNASPDAERINSESLAVQVDVL